MSYIPEATRPALTEAVETVPYPIEERRHELWRRLVNEYAPSLASVDPSQIFVVPVLPDIRSFNRDNIRSKIFEKSSQSVGQNGIDNTDTALTSALTTVVADLRVHEHPEAADLQAQFLTEFLKPPMNDPVLLGLHKRNAAGHEGGVIFLPFDTHESRSWAVLHNLNRIAAKEGQAILVRSFGRSLDAIVDDMEEHRFDPIVQNIRSRMISGGYDDLLRSHFWAEGTPQQQREHAVGIVLNEYAGKHYLKNPRFLKSTLANVLSSAERNGLKYPDILRLLEDYRYVFAGGNRAAEILQIDYKTLATYLFKAAGLHATARELARKYPADYPSALGVLGAVTYMTELDGEAFKLAKDSKRPPVISRTTLTVIDQELRAIAPDYNNGSLMQGLSDPIVSHELGHNLLAQLLIRTRKPGDSAIGESLTNEEHVVEAMNIGLGHKETVVQCVYYAESEEYAVDIETIAERFSGMSPEEREEQLTQYAAGAIIL